MGAVHRQGGRACVGPGFGIDTVRQTQGHKVVQWIERNCVHTNGEWIGRPFRFLPWQKRLVYELFEVGDDGDRRFRWALVGVPKKNGKTELAAALSLYLLIGDGEPSPLGVCGAASEEQADLVFGAARTMCEMSPTLRLITERWEKEITVPSIPGARLRRVAAAAGTNDGQNIHFVVTDELHEWRGPKGRQVWTVLTNGTGARRQPLILQITTAGDDIDGTICGEQYQYGKNVKAGVIDDPRYFFHWVEAPEDLDYREPEAWAAANPSYGVLVHEPFFRDQLGKKREAEFRRYFLNQWTTGETYWLEAGAWEACRSDLDLDPTLPVYVGVDVGIRHDSSAVSVAQKRDGRTIVRGRTWINPYSENDPRHHAWTLNIAEVEAYILELWKQYPAWAAEVDGRPAPGIAVYYDPTFFERSAQELARSGVTMVELPQNNSRMVPVSQTFYELIKSGELAHDGDPAMELQIKNVQADETGRGWRMSKPKGSRRKIDFAISTAIAAWAAQQEQPQAPRSVYEDRGLLAL